MIKLNIYVGPRGDGKMAVIFDSPNAVEQGCRYWEEFDPSVERSFRRALSNLLDIACQDVSERWEDHEQYLFEYEQDK